MGITIKNFIGEDDFNKNITVTQEMGGMSVLEYAQDMSVRPYDAVASYYAARMGVRRRQLACRLSECGKTTVQAGAMQWMAGDVRMASGVKGAGDLMGKMLKGKATGETAVKPEYSGTGLLVLEPTYKHLKLIDIGKEWGGGVVLSDGMFLAAGGNTEIKITARRSFSSAVAGGEGLFNVMLKGRGIACVEMDIPMSEIVILELEDDEVRIDGDYAVAWSPSLDFTVERSAKTLIGSAMSGEGLVNVYRGTGKIWMEPLTKSRFDNAGIGD